MSTNSYIRAIGDADYNFAYNDFTVEFFVKPVELPANNSQTLFEITNNESPAANTFTSTRFLTVLEQSNINAYGISISNSIPIASNVDVFTTTSPLTSNNKIFYNGSILQSDQYVITGNSVTLQNVTLSNSNTTVELGTILFQVLGSTVSSNVMHFVSAERFKKQFYLFLDGVSQSVPANANVAIPAQVLSNGNANLQRYGSPALLTIGANRDGASPFFGQFGDIKIVNGASLHVRESLPQTIISSEFTDANLGDHPEDIIIEGGNFIDDISNPVEDEFVPGQIFDTLYMQVYQTVIPSVDSANVNAKCLPWNQASPYNTNYIFNDLPTVGGIAPVSINLNADTFQIAISATGLVTNFITANSTYYGPDGNPSRITGNTQDPGFGYFPTICIPGSLLGEVGLCGAFANAGGAVIETLSIGSSSSFNVPNGATQLLLGVNDDYYNDNGGFFTANIYQYGSTNANPASNILSFAMFKPIIMAGPIGSFSYTVQSNISGVAVPWSSLDPAAASVLVNENPIASNAWSIINGVISIPSATIGSNVEIVATGPTTYYDVNANSVSIITSNLYANSTTINVANTVPFITPNIGNVANVQHLNVKGQVFVNQECISYLYVDRIANTISGLTRGTCGTGVPNMHASGSRIVSSSYNNDIKYLTNVDPRVEIWYTVPLNGTSLQNTNTIISTLLVDNGGLAPITSF